MPSAIGSDAEAEWRSIGSPSHRARLGVRARRHRASRTDSTVGCVERGGLRLELHEVMKNLKSKMKSARKKLRRRAKSVAKKVGKKIERTAKSVEQKVA
jgi:hypothetical protein